VGSTPASRTTDFMQTEPRSPRRILAVEDNTEFAEILCLELSARGFLAESVPNGVEGLKRILAEDFDAILCDVLMPHMPGPMFYLAVQKAKPHLTSRFIFMTGFGNDPKVEEFVRQSGRASLWKPFAPSELLATLQTVLDSGNSAKGA
jgi:two-component system, cell cycle sensor histidine kinase and response regulator CckA